MRARASRSARRGPAEQWEFVDRALDQPAAEGHQVHAVAIYELWYEATEAKVVGIGFAATRDLVSFLRYERADDKGTANPLAERAAAFAMRSLSAAPRAAASCATSSSSA